MALPRVHQPLQSIQKGAQLTHVAPTAPATLQPPAASSHLAARAGAAAKLYSLGAQKTLQDDVLKRASLLSPTTAAPSLLAAHASRLTSPPSIPTARRKSAISTSKKFAALAEYQEQYLGLPHSTHKHSSSGMSKICDHNYLSVSNLVASSDISRWHHLLPTQVELLKQPFGQEDTNHSFTQTACFETCIFHVLKSCFLDTHSLISLHTTHPLFNHLSNMIHKYATYDFSWLRSYNNQYAHQKFINKNKMKAFVACLFYYNLDVSLVMRFLSNNYTGEYRDVPQIIARIRPFVDADLLLHFERVMLSGCPNKMNYETSRENALLYWRKGNNPSIKNNLAKVMKTMNKEDKNNFVIPLPSWLARFIPHLFFTPQHNLVKQGKKDRLIFNAAERPTMNAVPVNMMTTTKNGTELACLFGDVKTKILVRAWNLRISFPDKDIVIHANDVKSCFRQLKHHPNVMGAFSFIIGSILFLQCGLTFGSDFSPANWEVPRQIAEQLAEKLFSDTSLIPKHRKYLDKLKWDVTLGDIQNLTPASPDTLNTGVLDKDGNPVNTPHDFFVDDGVYAEIFDKARIEQAVAASIEAIFILLGHSDLECRQDPISFDKMEEMVISHANKILGQIINTRAMEVETPKEFISDTIDFIKSKWHPKRKTFHLSEAEIIAGRLGYIAETSPWLKYLVSHLYSSIAHALNKNRQILLSTSAEFRAMLKLQKQIEASELHKSFALAHTAKAVHHHKACYHFNSTLREEIKIILAALSSSWVPKKRPIAHLIPRDPNGTTDSDSSLDAAGGYSFDMFYWWYFEWPPTVKKFTRKYIKS